MSEPPASGVSRRFRAEAGRWDQIYTDAGGWFARTWDRLTRDNVRRRFTRTFEIAGDLRSRTVLDLGCGSGRYLIEAAARGAARVVGVDFAPEMITTARGLADANPNGNRIELACSDIEALTLDERFDLVIANGMFDYLSNPVSAMRRAAAWSADLLVATFPDRRAPRALPRRFYWSMRGIRIRLFEPREIGQLAREAGFAAITVERIGPIFLLAARRQIDRLRGAPVPT